MAMHDEPQQPCRTCGTCPTCGSRPTQPAFSPDWTYYPPQPYINPPLPSAPYTNYIWSGRTWASDTTAPLNLPSGMASSLQNDINIGSGGIPINPTTDLKTS